MTGGSDGFICADAGIRSFSQPLWRDYAPLRRGCATSPDLHADGMSCRSAAVASLAAFPTRAAAPIAVVRWPGDLCQVFVSQLLRSSSMIASPACRDVGYRLPKSSHTSRLSPGVVLKQSPWNAREPAPTAHPAGSYASCKSRNGLVRRSMNRSVHEQLCVVRVVAGIGTQQSSH